MKKIIFIMALTLLISTNAKATDRDCAQYSSSEAVAATSDSSTNSVSIVFSGMTARKGTSNADCGTASSSDEATTNLSGETTGSGTQTTGGNENSSQETGGSETSGSVSPAPQTPEEEHNCPPTTSWRCENDKCECSHSGGVLN
ncbi:MAG: hypothetical protein IJ870_05505 [Alphaproteobacteria bacterium]|nr:hypothetical protein [Alphaproteobacteria bacterium]